MSISIGKELYKLIKDVARTFPIIGIFEGDPVYPFIVYQRTSLIPEYTKDMYIRDVIKFDIDIYAKDYDTSIRLAEEVRTKIDGVKVPNHKITLESAEEYFSDEGVFIQKLKICL